MPLLLFSLKWFIKVPFEENVSWAYLTKRFPTLRQEVVSRCLMSQGGTSSCLGCPRSAQDQVRRAPAGGKPDLTLPAGGPFLVTPPHRTHDRKIAQTHGQKIIPNSKAQVIYSLQSQKNAFLHLAFDHILIITSVEGVTS